MRALTWQGIGEVEVRDVPDPRIEEPTDAVVRVTSTAICGSDLHLYNVLAAYLEPGDVLGHEFMGLVEEVGPAVEGLAVGDRVVVPFTIACGRCWMCDRELYSQCETTQNVAQGKGASLFGYTSLYGSVPGGQAERVRVPHADFGPVRITSELPDERFLYLSDILPTAWQGVRYADVPEGGTLAVLGLGPVGQFALRVARYLGVERVVGVERVPARIELARRHGFEVVDQSAGDVATTLREMTDGRGPDAVLDAVGMEAHGSPLLGAAVSVAKRLPKVLARPAIETAGVDRLAALHTAIDAVRRGGTVSLSGVYGGMADPMPMMQLFDKQVQLRMGQCNVRRWTDELYDLVSAADDVLDVEGLATHRVPLEEAAEMYRTFNDKADGCVKVVLRP